MSTDDRPPPKPRRAIDGVVLVDKPAGITSNAALQRTRRAFGAEKAGHTGTLDPLATGLLPVCFGEATKFSAGLLDAEKGYLATLELGVTTDTGDREGAVLARSEIRVGIEAIEAAARAFRGDILQRPHRYSAIKRDGRALHRYAREGIEVEIAPRAVTIHGLDIVRWEPPLLSIDVLCSKGTYIRSLAEDIGARLGCGAHVAELRRTRVAHLSIGDSIALDEIEAMPVPDRDAWLRPVSLLVERLPSVEIDPAQAEGFLHGRAIALDAAGAAIGGSQVAVRRQGQAGDRGFLGLGRVSTVDGQRLLAPSRVIAVRRRLPE